MYEFLTGFAVAGAILAYIKIIRLERKLALIEQRMNRRNP